MQKEIIDIIIKRLNDKKNQLQKEVYSYENESKFIENVKNSNELEINIDDITSEKVEKIIFIARAIGYTQNKLTELETDFNDLLLLKSRGIIGEEIMSLDEMSSSFPQIILLKSKCESSLSEVKNKFTHFESLKYRKKANYDENKLTIDKIIRIQNFFENGVFNGYLSTEDLKYLWEMVLRCDNISDEQLLGFSKEMCSYHLKHHKEEKEKEEQEISNKIIQNRKKVERVLNKKKVINIQVEEDEKKNNYFLSDNQKHIIEMYRTEAGEIDTSDLDEDTCNIYDISMNTLIISFELRKKSYDNYNGLEQLMFIIYDINKNVIPSLNENNVEESFKIINYALQRIREYKEEDSKKKEEESFVPQGEIISYIEKLEIDIKEYKQYCDGVSSGIDFSNKEIANYNAINGLKDKEEAMKYYSLESIDMASLYGSVTKFNQYLNELINKKEELDNVKNSLTNQSFKKLKKEFEELYSKLMEEKSKIEELNFKVQEANDKEEDKKENPFEKIVVILKDSDGFCLDSFIEKIKDGNAKNGESIEGNMTQLKFLVYKLGCYEELKIMKKEDDNVMGINNIKNVKRLSSGSLRLVHKRLTVSNEVKLHIKEKFGIDKIFSQICLGACSHNDYDSATNYINSHEDEINIVDELFATKNPTNEELLIIDEMIQESIDYYNTTFVKEKEMQLKPGKSNKDKDGE